MAIILQMKVSNFFLLSEKFCIMIQMKLNTSAAKCWFNDNNQYLHMSDYIINTNIIDSKLAAIYVKKCTNYSI